MKRALGYFILSIPFICIFIYSCYAAGFGFTLLVFAAWAFSIFALTVGVKLIKNIKN